MSMFTPSRMRTKSVDITECLKYVRSLKKNGKPRRVKTAAINEFWGGREVCNLKTRAGKQIYRDRVTAMLERQKGLCCNCRKPLAREEATFEHENGRGAGKRDDRILVKGKPINGASHLICNSQRGSKRTPIWHGEEE